jgi:hypothetical protein
MALLLSAAVMFLLYGRGPLGPPAAGLAAEGQAGAHRPAAAPRKSDPMDEPLDLAAIDDAAGEALRLARTRDEMALASVSRDCHHSLRSRPTLGQFDRCVAFDDAVVQLQDRDPLRDHGPFAELAVTGRVRTGASGLSDDSLAIDGRLDRIRLRVELQLAGLSTPAPVRQPAAD